MEGANMETRNKLKEAKYFLEILPKAQEEPDIFYYNLGAFLNSWRSVLDIMLYDFAEYYALGFTREDDMDDKEFHAVATALHNEEAVKFIKWWRQKQGMLKNSPLWKKRIIGFHRGKMNIQSYVYVSGSGGTSGTISPYVAPLDLPDDSSLGALVPQAIPVETPQPPILVFSDFPDKNLIEMCTKAFAELEAIVAEAEKSFEIHL